MEKRERKREEKRKRLKVGNERERVIFGLKLCRNRCHKWTDEIKPRRLA